MEEANTLHSCPWGSWFSYNFMRQLALHHNDSSSTPVSEVRKCIQCQKSISLHLPASQLRFLTFKEPLPTKSSFVISPCLWFFCLMHILSKKCFKNLFFGVLGTLSQHKVVFRRAFVACGKAATAAQCSSHKFAADWLWYTSPRPWAVLSDALFKRNVHI